MSFARFTSQPSSARWLQSPKPAGHVSPPSEPPSIPASRIIPASFALEVVPPVLAPPVPVAPPPVPPFTSVDVPPDEAPPDPDEPPLVELSPVEPGPESGRVFASPGGHVRVATQSANESEQAVESAGRTAAAVTIVRHLTAPNDFGSSMVDIHVPLRVAS